MKYLKSSFKYFLDKGPYLALIAIVPALLTPFLLSPSASLYYLCNFREIDATSFATLYMQMRVLPFDFFYIGIAGIIVSVFVVAILLGVVDRHMRVGEFSISFSRAKTRLNTNIITAIIFIAMAGILFELVTLLTTVFYYLWAVLFGTGVTWLVLSSITFVVMSFLVLIMFSWIILWPAYILHVGSGIFSAFKTAWRQITPHLHSVAFALFVVALPFQIAMLITGILDCGIVVRTVLDGVCYAVVIPFYIVLMYTIFYDITGTEREDLKKIDIWSKKRRKKKNTTVDVDDEENSVVNPIVVSAVNPTVISTLNPTVISSVNPNVNSTVSLNVNSAVSPIVNAVDIDK